jgi:hypothetical protein
MNARLSESVYHQPTLDQIQHFKSEQVLTPQPITNQNFLLNQSRVSQHEFRPEDLSVSQTYQGQISPNQVINSRQPLPQNYSP